MAKKIVGDDDVLRPKSMDQLWRGGVTELPRYPLPEPRFNPSHVTFQIEHVLHFMRGQTLENRGADQPAGVGGVNALLRQNSISLLKYPLHTREPSGPVAQNGWSKESSRPRRPHCMRARQSLKWSPRLSCGETAHQFERRTVPEKERSEILLARGDGGEPSCTATLRMLG